MLETMPLKRFLLLLSLLTQAAVSLGAEPSTDSLTLQGIPLGLSEHELLERQPELSCRNSIIWSDRLCQASSTSTAAAHLGLIGGEAASYTFYFFADRLSMMTAQFPSTAFAAALEEFTARYGPPAPAANNGGEHTPSLLDSFIGSDRKAANTHLEWDRSGALLQAEKADGSDHAKMRLATTTYFAEVQRRQRARAP
ncbi:MAG: hypothetical protein ACYC2R_13805 [Burkholderiales bacterium]